MKLLFKQRFFSWLDSYDVYDQEGNIIFVVEGKLSWGHRLDITDPTGSLLGMVKEEVLTFLPRFRIYLGDRCIGEIKKEFTFFTPVFTVNCNGWQVTGDLFEWEYDISDPGGQLISHISKELFNFTDTYTLEVADPQNALMVLMIALAIDAAKCSSSNN